MSVSEKATKKSKHAVGRSTKYKPEFCDKLIKYFDAEPWKIVEGKRAYRRMPTIEGFAKRIKVCISTIYNWIDKDHASFQPEFLDAYNKAKQLRKNWLIDVGLSGLSPANSFKFVAVNCTDMRDKVQEEHTGPGGGPIELKVVEYNAIDRDNT